MTTKQIEDAEKDARELEELKKMLRNLAPFKIVELERFISDQLIPQGKFLTYYKAFVANQDVDDNPNLEVMLYWNIRAAELYPDYTTPRLNIAVINQELGNYEEALKSARQALTLYDPEKDRCGFNDALSYAASLLTKLERHEESLEYYDKVLDSLEDPDYNEPIIPGEKFRPINEAQKHALFGKGIALASLGRTGELDKHNEKLRFYYTNMAYWMGYVGWQPSEQKAYNTRVENILDNKQVR